MTLNGAWGYTANDHRWKSPQTVVQMLARAVNKGGNFLLNFGPTAEGEIPAESLEIMKQVGAWLRVNGEAIYGASPSALIATGKAAAESGKAPKGKAKKKEREEPEIDWLATSRPADQATGQPAKIYLHLFKWPNGRLNVKGVDNQVSQAYLLSDPKRTPLKFSQQDGIFAIELAGQTPDPIATLVCLECATGH